MSIETIHIGEPIILQAVLTSDPDLIVLRGYSAYEVAVRNGFEGTETEWLASLAEQATIIALGYANEAEEARDIAVAAKDDLLPILNDMANLLAVSAKLAEIDLVEAHLSEITILSSDLDLGENSKISVLSANISSIQLLDQNIDSINRLSDDLGEGINSNIKKVSESINNVDTVAGSISNVNNVGGSIADVNAVAGKLPEIETVADDLELGLSSKIGIVAGSIDNVNNVGGSIADVNAVAGKLTAVETVADDLDLGLSSKIGIVSTNIADINTVAEANDSVNTVAGSIVDVNTVATNVADVNTVAESSVKVGIVADNIEDVNLAADNIVAIQAAPTYAEEAEKWAVNPEDSPVETGKYSALHHSAKASAAQTAAEAARDKASDWAEEDEDVEVETGRYSAKHWAAKAEDTRTTAIFDTGLSVDMSYSGVIETYTAGENVEFGDWVYLDPGGKIRKADASSVETAFCVGFVVETITAGNAGKIVTNGMVRDDSWTWVTGGAQKIYLGETPGDAVQYVPTEDGSVVQLLGRPVTENILKVEINEVQAADELAWYGVTVDHNYSSPDLTRIAASEDYMTLHASLPVHSLIRSCLLNDDGTVNYYLDSDTKLLKEDGVTASVLDGTDGQVMVEFPTYYRNVTLEKDGQFFPKISLQPIPGFQRVEKFYISAYQVTIDRSGTTGTSGTAKFHSIKNTAPEYRGGNNQSEWDSDSRSLLGKPASYLRLDYSRRYARNRGDGWEVLPYRQSMLLYELYMIEYATLNSQKPVVSELTIDGYRQGGLGDGVTTTTGTIWNAFNSYYPFVPCGVADTLGNGSGEVTYVAADFSGAGNDITFKVAVYHGVENIFGHLYEWVDGANAFFEGAGGVGKLYLADARTKFADGTSVGYTLRSHIPTTDGYIKKMVFDREGILIPAETGGGLDTYYCDYMYQPGLVAGWRALRRGGSALVGTYAGFACVSALGAFSYAGASVGARLCFLTGNK